MHFQLNMSVGPVGHIIFIIKGTNKGILRITTLFYLYVTRIQFLTKNEKELEHALFYY